MFDLLIENATLERKNSESIGSLGIRDGYISFVSENPYPNVEAREILDLSGAFVYPGFIDSHIHIIATAESLMEWVDLKECHSVEEIAEKLEIMKGKDWLLGRGWTEDRLIEKRKPTATTLDLFFEGIPVCIVRNCGHMCVLNTKAMAILGLKSEDGSFYESDVTKIVREIRKSIHMDKENAILNIMRKLNASGITEVVDMDVDADTLKAYKKLSDEGRLTVKVRAFISTSALPTFDGLNSSEDEFFKVIGIKCYADGSLGASTAALSRGYKDIPENHGYLEDKLILSKAFHEAKKRGLSVAIHAIGDAGVSESLDIIEEMGNTSTLLPRIEHCQVLNSEIIARFSNTNIGVCIQPLFAISDKMLIKEKLYDEYLPYSYAWRKIYDTGVITVGGSDSPVENFAPLLSIKAAMENGTESLTKDEAFAIYTTNASKLLKEHENGEIEKGMKADLVVLSSDDPENAKVLHTFVNGKNVFSY